MSHGPTLLPRSFSVRSARFHDGEKNPISRTSLADSADGVAVVSIFGLVRSRSARAGTRKLESAGAGDFRGRGRSSSQSFFRPPTIVRERARRNSVITGVVGARSQRGNHLMRVGELLDSVRITRSAYCPGRLPEESRRGVFSASPIPSANRTVWRSCPAQ